MRWLKLCSFVLLQLAGHRLAAENSNLILATLNFEASRPDQRSEIEVFLKATSQNSRQEQPIRNEQSIRKEQFKGGIAKIRLSPGEYSIRTRSLDSRGVPGEWSELIDIVIKPKVALIPEAQKSLSKNIDAKTGKAIIPFAWAGGQGASSYRLEVRTPEKKQILSQTVKGTEVQIPLPPGDFLWGIHSVSSSGIESPPSDWGRVLVKGPRLLAPTFKQQKRNLILLEGGGSPYESSGKVDFKIQYHLSYAKWEAADWSSIGEFQSQDPHHIELPKGQPPGRYKLKMIAMAESWDPSTEAEIEIVIKPESSELMPLNLKAKTK